MVQLTFVCPTKKLSWFMDTALLGDSTTVPLVVVFDGTAVGE
jgi:hypothetical protein